MKPDEMGITSPSPPSAHIPHPVYSDFVHMQQMSTLTFAVGLREDNPAAMLSKIAPLAYYTPGIKKERIIKKIESKISKCTAPMCMNKKEKLQIIIEKNKNSHSILRTLDSELASINNKILLMNKSLVVTEEKSIKYRDQVEMLEQRIPQMEQDIKSGEIYNKTLQLKLEKLLDTINSLKAITESKSSNDKQANNHSAVVPDKIKSGEVIFSKKYTGTLADLKYINEVTDTSIIGNNYVSDSDDDDDDVA